MILVLTGATGFVGRNLLLDAIRSGRYSQIMLPVRSPEKLRAQLVGDGIESIPSHVRILPWSSKDPLTETIDSADHLVHTAGILYGSSRSHYWETNVDGTLGLLAKIKQIKRAVILSSQAAGGPGTRSEIDVDSPLTLYGKSKLEMERRVLENFRHLNVTFLRPPMVLGPRDTATLPIFKMAKYPVRFKPGKREKLYSFIAVSDLVEAINACLWNGSDEMGSSDPRYFVAHDAIVSDKDIIRAAADSMGRMGVTVSIPQPIIRTVSSLISRVPAWSRAVPSLTSDRAQDIFCDRWVVSPKRFEKTFKWRAKTDLKTAIEQARDWYSRSGQLN